MQLPSIAIVIPTRDRASYLDVALRSLAGQQGGVPHEVVVVDDGSGEETAAVASRAGVRCVRHDSPRGPNAARNSGIRATSAPVVAFLDDDVRVPARWLVELAGGVARHPGADAFGGPIRASLEGPAPRSCGRERPPITTLDLGPEDREAEMVWSANMAVRRRTFERLGMFDEAIPIYGEEEEWLLELRRRGGRIVYLGRAAVEHRRAGADARLRALARAEYRRGHAARATDERREAAPPLARELRVLAGCLWHAGRHRCPQGLIAGTHTLGRIAEALRRQA